MCGIAGYVGPHDPGDARCAAALRALGHRGPDARGARRLTTPDGRVVRLLHTRLSIIDLDPRADQPFATDEGLLAVNGELYDYVEVRRALEDRGVRFRTASDTEVIARAIDLDGWDALDSFEGMWAMARYDLRSGDLHLCRDRFGEKPLHIHRDGRGGLYFASEPKAIFALLGRRLPADLDHVRRFLVNGYKALHAGAHHFHRGLERLPAGSLLRVGPDGEELTRYWTPPSAQDDAMEYDDAVSVARDLLTRSVEIRLRSDVPLAFCLSGGVDSVSLASCARVLLGRPVHGFTIVNTDARYEEEEMVDVAVAALGVDSTKVGLTTDGFLPGLRTLVRAHDAPVSTITWYVQWLLMRRIHADGYRVSVSGTGADELFSGYYDHHLQYLAHVRGSTLAAPARAAWEEHVRPLVRNPWLRDPDLFADDPGFRGHITLGADEFAGYLVEPWSEPFAETAYTGDLMRNRMMNELYHEAVPVILHEDDLNAMSVSVENRSPFLDRPLAEHCARIPTRHLVRDGRAKAVLRDAMRGVAPEAVLDNRRKVGFNAPIRQLLDTADPAVRQDVLADSPLFDVVRRDRLEALLDREGELPNSESKLLFSILGVKMFLEECVA